MLVSIIKEWQTESVIEAPDGLSDAELKQWLSDNAEGVANDVLEATWQGTYCTSADTDEDICDWQ